MWKKSNWRSLSFLATLMQKVTAETTALNALFAVLYDGSAEDKEKSNYLHSTYVKTEKSETSYLGKMSRNLMWITSASWVAAPNICIAQISVFIMTETTLHFKWAQSLAKSHHDAIERSVLRQLRTSWSVTMIAQVQRTNVLLHCLVSPHAKMYLSAKEC